MVERFDPEPHSPIEDVVGMSRATRGDYVLYDDYLQLENKFFDMEYEFYELKKSIRAICSEM